MLRISEWVLHGPIHLQNNVLQEGFMKVKHRALAILLSAIMVLTFMPAMAFAEGGEAEEPTLELAAAGFTSVSYESETAPTGYIGTTNADAGVEGAVITLRYSGGRTEV